MATNKDHQRWLNANPWTVCNVSCIGRGYGRFESREAAEKFVRERGADVLSVEGYQVYFSETVWL